MNYDDDDLDSDFDIVEFFRQQGATIIRVDEVPGQPDLISVSVQHPPDLQLHLARQKVEGQPGTEEADRLRRQHEERLANGEAPVTGRDIITDDLDTIDCDPIMLRGNLYSRFNEDLENLDMIGVNRGVDGVRP